MPPAGMPEFSTATADEAADQEDDDDALSNITFHPLRRDPQPYITHVT